MVDFITTLLVFFLTSVIVISLGLLVSLCVLTVEIVKVFLEDMKDGSAKD